MARQSKLQAWIESFSSFEQAKEAFKVQWEKGGEHREMFVIELGYANEGAAYNAARNAGLLDGGPVRNGDGERKRAFKGVLPVKAALAVCKALGLDADEFETIDYKLYCQALGEQGDAWREFIFTRLGGMDSDGGKSFKAWIDYHVALDLEAQRKRERDADPMYQLKLKLATAHDSLRAANNRIQDLELKIAELTCDLNQAHAMAGPRRSTGGTLTAEMKRLMIQRFHPDKMNGNSPELYNSICAYINALETTD